jgi:hypothetical protein
VAKEHDQSKDVSRNRRQDGDIHETPINVSVGNRLFFPPQLSKIVDQQKTGED